VVIAGAPPAEGDLAGAVETVARLVEDGTRFSEAVKQAADAHSVRRRMLYEAARRRLDAFPEL
jgi:hypothetical protein